MPLLSAAEDIKHRTLGRIAGALNRLRYLAELRRSRYQHWGLRRTHGEEPAEEACREAHSAEFLGVLRTDLDDLVEETTIAAQASGTELESACEMEAKELIPEDTGGGSPRHLSALVFALRKLAWARKRRRKPPAA